jgi:D-sedoheptulose 7-phosphate isomerase
MKNNIKASLEEARSFLNELLSDEETINKIKSASGILIKTFENGGRIFSCGNGGSMTDAMHFALELSGRYRKDRKAYPAEAISDPGYLSCAANDFGYDFVFSRFLEGHASKGDTLIAISTSGTSANVVNAVKTAKSLGMKVIFLTGGKKTDAAILSDISIHVPGNFSDRKQELHIKILHIFVEMIERHFHPENY